jgi:small conductance mechanosensitive channel
VRPLDLAWPWPKAAIIIGVTVVAALAANIIVVWIIDRSLRRTRRHVARQRREGGEDNETSRVLERTTAVTQLIKSLWHFLLVLTVVLLTLQALHVPIAPVLTSAGIGGVVLAFGAQSLVKDYLSGISMILEDQFGVGDQIRVGDITGIVEDVTLRITKLRDANGMIWYIRNGEITRIGNDSQGYSTSLIDVPVAYDADVTQVTAILAQTLAEAQADPEVASHLLEPPQVLGVESITATTMTLRIRIKTPPNQQYALARDIRERAMAALNAAGIPGPTVIPSL